VTLLNWSEIASPGFDNPVSTEQTGRVSAPEAVPSRVALAAAQRLNLDRVAAEVVVAVREAGIRSIVLKGPAFAAWLDDSRVYQDADVLVDPRELERAQEVVARLGFTLYIHDEGEPPDPHAWMWVREEDGVTLDLHRSLPLLGVGPDEAWDILAARTEPLAIGRVTVEMLDREGTALHAAIHAALHRPDVLEKPRRDLAFALERFDLETWRRAAELARQLGAEAALATGLRSSEAGSTVADELGLSDDLPARVASRHRLQRLAEGTTLRSKISLVGRLLVPRAAEMRFWFPLARRGRLGLLAAHLWRLARAPWRRGAIAQAWRKARSAGHRAH
jgi:hypothetical protein